ncbi:MAG: hypothetical protein QW835_05665 [Candidatus Hadarchaeum sp.]|uniref:hypothetical protein n=1 Tax=Candidatus Hadarchaeum sp. TaxID=2883567 RepID=UPI00316D2977
MSKLLYKEQLKEYLQKHTNRKIAAAIFKSITSQYKKKTEIGRLREKASSNPSELMYAIEGLKEKILKDKEFSASVVPTVISSGEARNLLFSNEKEPTEESVYFWLSTLLTGFASGSAVVNLINVDERAKEDFRDDLIGRKVIIEGKVDREKLQNISGRLPFTEYTFAFELLNYFMFWCRTKLMELQDRKQLEKWRRIGIIENLPQLIGVRDDTALVVYWIPRREKRKAEFIPRIRDFTVRWYSDFLENFKIEQPPLGKFLSSLYVPGSKESGITLDKFIFYLLRGEINGELIEELVNSKAEGLTRRKPSPILWAEYFFSKL